MSVVGVSPLAASLAQEKEMLESLDDESMDGVAKAYPGLRIPPKKACLLHEAVDDAGQCDFGEECFCEISDETTDLAVILMESGGERND